MPATALPALLFSFLPWLERHLPACPAPAPLVVPESLLLPLRGTALRVISAGPLAEGRRQTPSCTEPPLLLRSGSKRLLALVRHEELRLYAAAAPEDAALLLRHWCRRQAEKLLPPYLQQLARQGGLTVARVTVRDQRRRWGSCSARDGGSISLNWRAVLLPLSLLEHLCWHELCHLRHMDHSPAYRQTLAKVSPDWKLQERRLTAFWRDLPVWARPCPVPAPEKAAGRTALQAHNSPV